jgi:glycosyltransferase involved in cell wall biosynthesis
MNTQPSLSVIIPAYNEAERIGVTLLRIEEYANASGRSLEVIIVDDGSTDDMASVVRGYSGRLPGLRLVVNESNKGKGYAVRRGMLEASGLYRLFMDADNSVDISHVDAFLERGVAGTDVVIGSIKLNTTAVVERNGIHRRLLGSAANFLIQLLAVPGIQDTQRGFKLFSARAANRIFSLQTIERFGFDIEILVIARQYGFSIEELPVAWDNPSGSKVTWRSYAQTLRELYCISRNRFLRRYDAPRVLVLERST